MTYEAYVQGFGCLPRTISYEEARQIVLPIPLEWGCQEAPGVGLGPMAVLGASRFLETFDAELGFDPLEQGVATLDGPRLEYEPRERPLRQIQDAVEAIHVDGKFPLCIGGDRVLALPAALAGKRRVGEHGVLLLSRRPGLLDSDLGRTLTARTLGRRVAERLPTAIVGSRWWSAEEAATMTEKSSPPLLAVRELLRDPKGLSKLAKNLPRAIHLSIDVGVLGPATLPMPGNNEPGGLDWYGMVDLVDDIFASFEVLSCDVSGFVPVLGNVAPSLLVAQLILHCLGRARRESS